MKKCRIDKYLVPGEEVIYRAKISKMTFLTEFILKEELKQALDKVYDLERLSSCLL